MKKSEINPEEILKNSIIKKYKSHIPKKYLDSKK